MKKSYLLLIFCLSLAVAAFSPIRVDVLADGDEGDTTGEVNPDGGDTSGGESTTPSNPWTGWGNNGSSDGTGNANTGNKPNPTPDVTGSTSTTTNQNPSSNTASTSQNDVAASNNPASQNATKRSSATGVTTQMNANNTSDDTSIDEQEIAEATDNTKGSSDSEATTDEAPAIIATIRHINPWIVAGIFTLVAASVAGIAILATFLLKKRAKKLAEPKLLSEETSQS